MEEFNRDFKGVWIPKAVWLDSRLNALDKIILTEIDSLDQGERGCYASNQYISEFCQCSERKVSEAITKLIKCGYIYVQKFDGRQREMKSCLANYAGQPSKICEADTQNLRESNIYNNTMINIEKKERKKTAGGFDEIIGEYTSNEELKQALVEFIKMRKLIKKPLTDYALKRLLSQLNKLESTEPGKIMVVNQSITRGWAGFFPLKDAGTFQKAPLPVDDEYQKANKETADRFAELLGGGNDGL